MLHILLTILKILGILLLVLVGLLLLIILSVLFVPVCYRAQGKRTEDELCGKAAISWLFRLLYARIEYREGKSAFEIYAFGIPLLALKRKLGEWKKSRRIKKADSVQKEENAEPEDIPKKEPAGSAKEAESSVEKAVSDGIPEKTTADDTKDLKIFPSSEVQQEPGESQQSRFRTIFRSIISKISGIWNKGKNFIKKLCGLPAKAVERLRKFRLTFRGFCDKINQWHTFLQMDDTRQAVRFLKGKGKLLFRHILPRKIRGKIRFGFEDPSLTGKILAGASVVYPLYKDSFQIIPVFDSQVLEGEVELKGRMFGGYLLWQAWQIYRNREVKVTYRRFQHKEA